MATFLDELKNNAGGITSGALGGIFNVFGNMLTNRSNRKIMEQQNAFNAQQADINRQWQEDMYNKYSSPSAMVRQYQEAGLNPVLAGQYGGQTFSGSTAQSSGNIASVGSGIESIAPSIMSVVKLATDVGVAKSVENRNNAEAEKLRSEKEGRDIENQFKPEQLRNDLEQQKLNIENTKLGLTLLQKQIILADDQHTLNLINLDISDAVLDKTRKESNLLSEKVISERLTQKNLQQTEQNLKAEEKLLIQEELFSIAKQALTKAEEANKKANTDYVSEQSAVLEYNRLCRDKFGFDPTVDSKLPGFKELMSVLIAFKEEVSSLDTSPEPKKY